ncbi:MAG: hypothetical protein WDA24_03415 [Tissierellales bacterium]
MKEIIFIEIVSIASFLYSVFMIFFSFAPINEMSLMFLWTIAISMFYAMNYRKSRLYDISILLLLIPLIFYNGTTAVLFILVITILIFLYIRKSLSNDNHYSYVDKVKKTYLLYIPLVYIRFIFDDFYEAMVYAIPFIIIYFLSSIILARTIRHLDSNMGMENIRRSNLKNLIMMAVIFGITTFERLRASALTIIEEVLNLLYYPIYLLGRLIKIPFEGMKIEEQIDYENSEKIVEDFQIDQFEIIEDLGEEKVWDFTIAKRILGFILIVVAVYIIYKLIINAGNRRYEGIEYVEEREYIRDSKKKKKRFKRDKYPKELKEQIKYFYRKFLGKLIRKDIEILKTDSTFEISKKAEYIFEDEVHRIREIYINSRYGEIEVDKSLVEEMETLYKKL